MRHVPITKAPRPKKAARVRKASRPAASFRLTGEARQVAALARKVQAEDRGGNGGAMGGYHARRQFDQRMTLIASRIASRPRALRDDLLALALAGWYAAGARESLVKTILRAGGLNPDAPQFKVRLRR